MCDWNLITPKIQQSNTPFWKWSAWQELHLHCRRFELRASALGYTRWCPRLDLHQHCARFKCAVSALDYVGLANEERRIKNEERADFILHFAFFILRSKMVPREGFPPPTSPF